MGADDFTHEERQKILDNNFVDFVMEPEHLEGVEPYPSTSMPEWLDEHPPPLEPILDGLFERGDKVEIIAPAKSRKSFMAMQLGMCAAMGSDFIGIGVEKPQKVILCQMEVKAAWLHRRVRRMVEGMDVAGDEHLRANLCVLNLRGVSFNPLMLERTALDFGAELIIIDPIYMLLDGSENDIDAWRPIVGMFDRLAERSGAAIAYVHHDAKGFAGARSIQDRGAGSNILGRSCDARITLTPHAQDDDCQVFETMNRNYAPREPITIEFNGAYFTASDLPPIKQTGPAAGASRNPLTDIPDAEFHGKVKAFCAEVGLLPTQSFIIKLGDTLGTTRRKTREVFKSALDADVIWKTKRQGQGGAAMIGTPKQVKEFREPEL
jgi:hypothetical protein